MEIFAESVPSVSSFKFSWHYATITPIHKQVFGPRSILLVAIFFHLWHVIRVLFMRVSFMHLVITEVATRGVL